MAKSSDPFKTESTETTPEAAVVSPPATAPVQTWGFELETLFGKKSFTFASKDQMEVAAIQISVHCGANRVAEIDDIAGKHLLTNSVYIFLGKQISRRLT